MKRSLLVVSCVILPLVSSFITYTFVSVGNNAIMLDENQALIVILAIIKMILLGSSGVFPIQLNDLINSFLGRERRTENLLYKVPPVHQFPCTRRLLCEAEVAARTSDSYNRHRHPEEENDRNTEEEVSPTEEDPFTEMHIEAVKALFREEESEDLTANSRKALGLVEGLTGQTCEEAYRRCPGRYTGGMFFRSIFDEFHYRAKEEL